MAYVQFSAYRVHVLHVYQCLTNLGFPVFSQQNRHATNPVTNCTCWPVLGPYNNWTIIELTPKLIPFEAFDEIHQVVLDGISENMASLFQSGMYGDIGTADNTENGFYVIQFISEAYKLQKIQQLTDKLFLLVN